MPQRLPRKVLYSLVLVLLWLGFLVEGSHALLVTSASITGNEITTGSVALLVSSDQGTTNQTFSATRPGFSSSLVPGQVDQHYFTLRNTSPSNVPLDVDVSGKTQTASATLLAAAKVTFTPVSATGIATGTPFTDSLQEVLGSNASLNVTIPAGADQRFRIDTTIDPNFPSASQDATYDLIFTGVQHYAP